jgi:sialate O-acetylesterase
MNARLRLAAVLVAALGMPSAAKATVAVNGLFSDHTVLQRDRSCPIWGTAAPDKIITVAFNGQTKTTTSDSRGNWQLSLDAMAAKAAGADMTIAESGANTITVTDVVVGDVWMCGGQSNMTHNLSGSDHDGAIAAAKYPGIRWMWVDNGGTFVAADPLRTVRSTWKVCDPRNIGGFSAMAFYFAREIYLDQKAAIPIGLIGNSVGGTRIDPWLIQEGCTDIPVLAPLYELDVSTGPFCLANSLVHPVSPFAIKGLIWYQGENSENTVQSADSYFLKMKALRQGYKRVFALDDLAFYFVQIANWGDNPSHLPNDPTPVMSQGGWAADTRLQQANAVALPHSGMASAVDIGESKDWHPKDKLDVGKRLALWALRNDYGRTILETSGPILRDVTVSGNKAICTFDHAGDGLMVGSKTPYQPTKEVAGGKLALFSVAGSDGVWHWANATIVGNAVEMTSPSVTAPKKVAYANWTNPLGANLYNKVTLDGRPDGLPASPFCVDDITTKCIITATAGAGGRVSPPGKASFLRRKAALYAITPDKGYFIQDVTVDGVSVGSVNYYTFDPLYANHTMAATFASTAPTFNVTSSSGPGGSISPSGVQTVAQGGSQTFSITPNSGVEVTGLTVDGKPMGKRRTFTFADVRTSHTISASFICSLDAQGGYGGTITPNGIVAVSFATSKTFAITPMEGYSIAGVKVDGTDAGTGGTYEFKDVVASHSIAASFKSKAGIGAGSVPQKDQLIFACLSDALPAKGPASVWPAMAPAGKKLSAIDDPEVVTIDGRPYARVVSDRGKGFTFASYDAPIACEGASIVVVARPMRNGRGSGWTSIVDVFYDRLVLGIRNDSGLVCIRMNGSLQNCAAAIPSGQITILSLIVQVDGTYKAYANGTEIMSGSQKSDMTALRPGVPGPFGRSITIGRNAPDAWTTFNGDIGDVFLYKTALTAAERQELERYIARRLTGTGR